MNKSDPKKTDTTSDLARRDFARIAVSGAALLSTATPASAKMTPIPPGIKIGTSAGQPTEENMLYLKQLGVTWVSLARNPQKRHRRRLHRDARAVGSRRLQGL